MPAVTAIELDGDTCAIARTTIRGREVTVSAAELLTPASFPGTDAFVSALRNTRRALRLPRRSRVVLWGLPDGATPRDPGAAAALAPLTAAGFKVERVVTPCNALGALSRVKPFRGDDAICWVAINTAGVAIAAIRPGQQIYARSFGWNSAVGSTGSQARLLHRYSLVAYLSPEVKRALAAARTAGYPVRAVVTCGNLPDLRSLTMPLIEELDVEVETLDSLDGLLVSPAALDRLTDIAAAIRVACAGVLARRTRPWDLTQRGAAQRTAMLMRAAAVVAVLAGAGGGYKAYNWWRTPRLVDPRPATVARTSPQAAASTPPLTPAVAASKPVDRPAVQSRQPAPPWPTPQSRPSPRAETPPARTEPPAVTVSRVPEPAPPAAPPAPPAGDAPALGIEPRYSPAPPGETPALLKDPLPRVTAILVSNDRRYAAIDGGKVVGIGDAIGRRVVVRIDERTVTLREPSGARVQVGLGGRLVSAR